MAQLIASASEDLQIWEFVSQGDCKSLSKCSFSGIPTSLSWNHTNQVVAVGLRDKRIDLVQATTGQLLSTLPFSSQEGILAPVRAVKFSGNSRYLASTEGTIVQLWDLKKRALKTKLEGHKSTVVAVSFFADGTIAAGDNSGAIRIWDVKTDSSYREMNVDQPSAGLSTRAIGLTCMELSFSGPSRIAAGYTDGSLSLWDPVTLTQLRKQIIHKQDISSISFSPKNPRLVATSSHDGRMTLVDTGSKSSDASASIDIGSKLTSITFHEDAIHCAVGTENGRVLFYDWRNVRKPIVTIESQSAHPVHALSFQVPKIKTDAAVATPVKKTFTSFSTTTPLASPRTPRGDGSGRVSPHPLTEAPAVVATSTATSAVAAITAAITTATTTAITAAATAAVATRVAETGVAGTVTTPPLPAISAPPTSGMSGIPAVSTGSKQSVPTPTPEASIVKKNIAALNKTVMDTATPSKKILALDLSNHRDRHDDMAVERVETGGDTLNNSLFRDDDDRNDNNENIRYNGENGDIDRRKARSVTSVELAEALQMMKYDMHKELQVLMREQVRQFAIAKEDTTKLFQELNSQLLELLISNKELRAENDQLRRIY